MPSSVMNELRWSGPGGIAGSGARKPTSHGGSTWRFGSSWVGPDGADRAASFFFFFLQGLCCLPCFALLARFLCFLHVLPFEAPAAAPGSLGPSSLARASKPPETTFFGTTRIVQ